MAAPWAAALAFVAALVSPALPATAVNRYWIGGSGQWDVAGNWAPVGQPQAGDDVFLTQYDGTDRTVTYSNTTNPDAVLRSLRIDATGTGTMTLDIPNDHPLSVNFEYVGYNGIGAITQSAGTHSAAMLYLGFNAGSAGSAAVTGAGSSWIISGDLYVGRNGSGTLTVADGGAVTAGTLWGHLADILGNGRITVTQGAVLDGDLVLANPQGGMQAVAAFGNGGILNLSEGLTGPLGVGYRGAGTLRIAGGVAIASARGYLGYGAGSSGSATVSGAGSTWTNTYELHIGEWGNGTLDIEAGGQVSSGSARVGGGTGCTGAVTVSGVGSEWTIGGGLNVGLSGQGILRVQEGGWVRNLGTASMGEAQGSCGTALVTGDGSKWTSSTLYVGRCGSGTLNVDGGGHVYSYSTYLGWAAGATGTATVTGAGSAWTCGGPMYVGCDGSGTLNVVDGGKITTEELWASLGDVQGDGTIEVREGAVLDADIVFDGTHGPRQALVPFGSGGALSLEARSLGTLGAGYKGVGSLRISCGVTIESNRAYLGYSLGSTGAATVTGPGSVWTNDGSLYVGHNGAGTLTVTDGARVSAGTLWASLEDLHGDGMVTATSGVLDASLAFDDAHGIAQTLSFGTGGTLLLTMAYPASSLGVGYKSVGTMRVSDGLTVASVEAYLGVHAGSSGTATVTGEGSTWANSSDLCIGQFGSGTLLIEDGGGVCNAFGRIGTAPGATGEATVRGAGSAWTNSLTLYVGEEGNGTLTVEAGGQVSSENGYLGCHVGARGEASVTGDGSRWVVNRSLYVGFDGDGTLNIEGGGQVSNADAPIAYDDTSTGTVTVQGMGSLWANTGSLFVGGNSYGPQGTGVVTVTGGGRVTVHERLRLWKTDSLLAVNGGTVTAGMLEGTNGTIRITDPAGGTALTVGSAASGTFAGALRDDMGPGSLTKVGTGTQTLSGAGITYTGTTTVLEGTLRLSNTTAFASNIVNAATTEFEVTAGTWTFDEALGGAGAFTKSGAGTLVLTGPQDCAAGAAFDILGGALVLNTDASGTGLMADAHLSLSVTASELRFGSNQHLDTLTVGNSGKVVFAGASSVVLRHLVNAGTIDVTTGNLIVDSDISIPLTAVLAMLASGCAGGTWDGPGIASSAAASDPDGLTAVGVLDNTDPKVGGKTTLEGEAVHATAVLVKYTWWGDANLDGVVDANDYDVIDSNYLFPPAPENTGWWTGDFTYDGVVDANDYDLIDPVYLLQTGPLAAGDAAAPAATPEPATLALVALGGLSLLGRRRRVR